MADHAGAFSEEQVIARLREIFTSADPRIEVGIGDDAAVVVGSKRQVLTTDMAVEGIHFRTQWSSGFEIGRKIAAANTADVLAMGAVPDYLLVAVGLTGSESLEWISELARGIKYEADLAGAHVVGGDISRAEQIVISMAAVGTTDNAILRNGAKPGDGIYLSSLTGWSAAGLSLLKSDADFAGNDAAKALSEFKSPTIDYGFVTTGASALCDVSDALATQAAQMAESSGVAFKFDLAKISGSAEFAQLESLANAMQIDIWQWIFSGGEDHVLLATGKDLSGILIGEVEAGSGLHNLPTGVAATAWSHFN
jgi:thiamine-monophosphate kinase